MQSPGRVSQVGGGRTWARAGPGCSPGATAALHLALRWQKRLFMQRKRRNWMWLRHQKTELAAGLGLILVFTCCHSHQPLCLWQVPMSSSGWRGEDTHVLPAPHNLLACPLPTSQSLQGFCPLLPSLRSRHGCSAQQSKGDADRTPAWSPFLSFSRQPLFLFPLSEWEVAPFFLPVLKAHISP